MSDPYQPFPLWQPKPPPPRPPRPDPLVIVLAALIAVLLVTGAVAAALKAAPASGRATATGRPTGSVPTSVAPSTSTTEPAAPSSTAPPLTTPPATSPLPVVPVSPLAVPPANTPPITARPANASGVAAVVDPSVIDIDTRLAYQHAIAAGTGMVLTANGLVLTNNHVIDGATSISAVSVGTGRSFTAHVVGVDPSADVAVIQLDGASGLRPVITNTAGARIGDSVVAIGNAGGLGGVPTVTSGSVRATGQSIIASDPAAGTSEQLSGLIETDATLQPGDSGGPLANASGQVIGMNTAASVNQASGSVSFAIPIAVALGIANQIQAGQASGAIKLGLPAFLGVTVVGASNGARSGALVGTVIAGGPAAAVGMVAGSLIVGVSGQTVDSPATLSTVLRQFRPGDMVTVTWIAPAGATRNGRATLATGPAD